MFYLLDTNHCVYIINGLDKKENFRTEAENKILKIARETKDNLFVSEVTLGELYFGAEYSKKIEYNIKRVELFNRAVTAIPVSERIWRIFARYKAMLKKQGRIITDFDLLIATTAKANNLKIVTNDSNFKTLPSEFETVDWTK